MAIVVSTNASVLINAVDVSDHIVKVTLDYKAASIDATAMSSGGYKSFVGGLKEFSLALDIQQDYAASKIDATLKPLVGTVTTFEVRPVNSARSATNPGYTGSILVTDYPAVAGQVGQLMIVSVSYPGTGALTENFS